MLIVGAVFTLCMTLLSCRVLTDLLREFHAARTGILTHGHISDLHIRAGQPARQRFAHGHVTFTTQGGESIRFREARPLPGPVGTRVPVRYRSSRPQSATICESRDLIQPLSQIILAIVVFAGGCAVFVYNAI